MSTVADRFVTDQSGESCFYCGLDDAPEFAACEKCYDGIVR